ncbi:hypothetical protein HC891_26880 [Candidatus Gracilibacteria bacterium]|nr:hypothetical protein [Candidatus Gracilibacteria bacterium]
MDQELHVVYGSGPVGTAVVEELIRRGKRVRVATASGQRKHLPVAVDVVQADATSAADARRVTRGATQRVQRDEPARLSALASAIPALAARCASGCSGQRRTFDRDGKPVYVRAAHGASMHEDMPMRGVGLRSTTRRAMTEELFAAHRSGNVRAVSVRASDLFGPHVTESLVGERLFAPLLAGKSVPLLARLDVRHSVSFIADVGRALVEVGADDNAYGRAWHAPNAPAVTLREFIALVAEEAQLTPQVSALPRPAVRALLPILALFTPQLRGLEENIYIAYESYIVDHSRYTQHFGDHATPLREAIRTTIAWYRGQNSEFRTQDSEGQMAGSVIRTASLQTGLTAHTQGTSGNIQNRLADDSG